MPGRFVGAIESLVEFVHEQARSIVKGDITNIAPLALCSFVWIVMMNALDLLPVDLLIDTDPLRAVVMVISLLLAGVIWNLGTWWMGLPVSSSHTLIGSIIGVGVANAVLRGRDGTSGVDWGKATEIGYALLLSPLVITLAVALMLLRLQIERVPLRFHLVLVLLRLHCDQQPKRVRHHRISQQQ